MASTAAWSVFGEGQTHEAGRGRLGSGLAGALGCGFGELVRGLAVSDHTSRLHLPKRGTAHTGQSCRSECGASGVPLQLFAHWLGPHLRELGMLSTTDNYDEPRVNSASVSFLAVRAIRTRIFIAPDDLVVLVTASLPVSRRQGPCTVPTVGGRRRRIRVAVHPLCVSRCQSLPGAPTTHVMARDDLVVNSGWDRGWGASLGGSLLTGTRMVGSTCFGRQRCSQCPGP